MRQACSFKTCCLFFLIFIITAAALILYFLKSKNTAPLVKKEYLKAYGKPEPIKPNLVKQPNILFITCDQLNWMNIGYNNPMIKTPNIDKLAASGTIYNRAYSSSPVCTPTRASWITGLYPSQHGAYALGTNLPDSVPCIGDYVNEAG